MTYFTRTPVAAKPYTCSTCSGKIEAGQRYERTTIPPDHNDIGNEGWWTIIRHLSPGQCWYETEMLRPGERNPCAVDNVTMAGGATPNQGTLVVDCACGANFSVPQGGDEGAAVDAAFAAHVREQQPADDPPW